MEMSICKIWVKSIASNNFWCIRPTGRMKIDFRFWMLLDYTMILGWTVGIRLFGQYHKLSMIISCTVRVIYYNNRDSPITILPCMCITQETFIDIVMSWYDHYCADANILILSYLPCWSYICSTIAFIMSKSFVCKFVLLMLNVFILVHKWFIWMVVVCHVFCILCCICIFYHVLCQKWQNKYVKSLYDEHIYDRNIIIERFTCEHSYENRRWILKLIILMLQQREYSKCIFNIIWNYCIMFSLIFHDIYTPMDWAIICQGDGV